MSLTTPNHHLLVFLLLVVGCLLFACFDGLREDLSNVALNSVFFFFSTSTVDRKKREKKKGGYATTKTREFAVQMSRLRAVDFHQTQADQHEALRFF